MRRSRGWADETGLGGISRRERTGVASAPHYKFAEYADGPWPYNRAFPLFDREVVEMSIPRNVIAIAATIAATVATASAHAEIGVGVTATLGTTGAGVHLVVPMERTLNGRFGINYYKHDFDKRSGGIDYDGDAKLQTFDALFDWYAFADTPLRLTAGVVYNGNEVTAKARPNSNGRYLINGQSYSAADVGTLDGNVDFRKAAPYFGIGWGNALTPNKRWNVSADLGAFYQGKGQVDLISRGCRTSQAVCAVLVRDVAVEEARLTNELADHKFFPVLRASVSYSF